MRLVPILVIGMSGVLVFHGALPYFFAQDDFAGLARASGLQPRLTGPWRYMSQQLFFDVMWRLFSTNPLPYHLVSLLAHGACAVLLYRLLCRRISPQAALAGSVFFVVHPALFTAVYWVSAIGDSLALFFGLAALALALKPGRQRYAAVPLFVLSLLAKESTLLLPAVALACRHGVGGSERPPRSGKNGLRAPRRKPSIDDVVVATAMVSLVYLCYFFVANRMGFRDASGPAPYAVVFDANVVLNLVTYVGWTANFLLPTVRGFSDAVDPLVYPWAIGAALLWLLGLTSRSLRQRGLGPAGAAYLLLLLPVLPLKHHTYHYYLYAPMAAAAWCVGLVIDVGLGRRSGDKAPARGSRAVHHGRAQWTWAAVLVAALTANGALLVHKIETHPFVIPELRSDPIIDRARIARNVYDALKRSYLPSGTTLLFWSPAAQALPFPGAPPTPSNSRETYWETNVRTALHDGLAVRVLFKEVAAVAFVRTYSPGPPDRRYAIYSVHGNLEVASSAELDSLMSNRPTR